VTETKFHISKEWLEIHYVNKRLSTRECAELLRCEHHVIRRALKSRGIAPRTRGEFRKIEISVRWLEENYINKQLTAVECGGLIGCSKTTVLVSLRENGIPIRKEISPRSRAKIRDRTLGRKASAETIEKLRISHLGKKRTPEQIAKGATTNTGKKRSLETCENISKALAGNPKLRGNNASGWRGGVSKQKYCSKFNVRTKRKTRERFNRTCLICGASENGRKHAVHHIDYNKLQGCKGKSWALVTLCQSCHGKTCWNRWYWFNRLINYWTMNPEINFSFTFGTCQIEAQ
jgi:hypothetical protein